jgi:hypothetical protein
VDLANVSPKRVQELVEPPGEQETKAPGGGVRDPLTSPTPVVSCCHPCASLRRSWGSSRDQRGILGSRGCVSGGRFAGCSQRAWPPENDIKQTAAEYAADLVAPVRDDPAGRLALMGLCMRRSPGGPSCICRTGGRRWGSWVGSCVSSTPVSDASGGGRLVLRATRGAVGLDC